ADTRCRATSRAGVDDDAIRIPQDRVDGNQRVGYVRRRLAPPVPDRIANARVGGSPAINETADGAVVDIRYTVHLVIARRVDRRTVLRLRRYVDVVRTRAVTGHGAVRV